jgi:hypothetical protein
VAAQKLSFFQFCEHSFTLNHMSTTCIVTRARLPPASAAFTSSPAPPSPLAPAESHGARESFGASIRAFVNHAESNIPKDYTISELLRAFQFQRRRFYDVVSVLAAVGCCSKLSSEALHWNGIVAIPGALLRMQCAAGADLPETTLAYIIAPESLFSISRLTVAFIMCFLVLRMPRLSIKNVSRYLTRGGRRWKSTLCKLYQVAHILEASGILERSAVTGEVIVSARFFHPVDIICNTSPFGLNSILNRERPAEEVTVQRRRLEFQAAIDRSNRPQTAVS